MTSTGMEPTPPTTTVRARAVIFALLFIPVNAYWVVMMEAIKYTGHPTTYSLFFNVVILLSLLLALNFIAGKIWRPFFNATDFIVIYFMIAIGTALAGHDQAQVLIGVICWPIYKATAENNWTESFGEFIPRYLIPRDPEALKDLFVGHSSFFAHWQAWVVPLGAWLGFTVVLLFSFFCINVVVRRQWVENERLTFPLVALPLEMVEPNLRFFRSRLMWIAFCIPLLINIVNNLNQWFPGIPAIATRNKTLGMFLTSGPWRAIGGTPIYIFPFAIGIGYLLPLDVLGSSWLFYWYWRLQIVGGAHFGLTTGAPNAPYVSEQAYGGYLALAVFSIYAGRRHIGRVLRAAVGRDPEYAQSRREGLPYGVAVWGFVASFILLAWFAHEMGMEWIAIIAVYVGYFCISLAIDRLRAEFGSPTHDLHNAYSGTLMVRIWGPRVFTPRTLTGFALFNWFSRAHRSHPMPVHLESLVASWRLGVDQRKMTVAMAVAALVGLVAAYIGALDPHYRYGVDSAKTWGLFQHFGNESWGRLASYINTPQRPEPGSLYGVIVGFLTCTALFVVRMQYVGFPLHPVGYAVSSSWSLDQVWLSLLIAWVCKVSIVRYGGLRLYRKAVPFFLGLILGDFLVGGLFNLVGIFADLPVYHFLG